MKKALVLIGGIFNTIDEKWWINFSEHTGLDPEFALSIWSGTKIDLGNWVKSRIVWLDREDPKTVAPIYEGSIPNITNTPAVTKPINTLLMWHKWDRFCNFENFNQYECVIKTRADVELDNNQIENLINVISQIKGSETTIAIPSGGDYSSLISGHSQGINDVFAIGSPRSMRTYLSIIRFWLQYYQSLNMFHPESLLRYHLVDKNRLDLIRFPAILYLRNHEYNHLNKRWYKDKLPLRANFFQKKIDRFKRSGKIF